MKERAGFVPGLTSLVLPAYNPKAMLDATLGQLREALRGQRPSWEVIVVLDGCTDGSEHRLASWLERWPMLRVVSRSPNRGKGYAVRAGLSEARGQWRLFTDVDLAYPPADILRLASRLQQGSRVVIGSRGHVDSRVSVAPALVAAAYRRQIQSAVFARLVQAILPLRHRDTQAGLKGMSAEVACDVLPRLRCDGFGFDCEFLTACTRLGIDAEEMSVSVRYDSAGTTVRTASILRTIRELWRIRRAWSGAVLPVPRFESAERPKLRAA